MKVKELKAKYKGYHIIEKGYPDSLPFAELPKECQGLYGKALEKVINELEVKGYKVVEEESVSIDITHCILGGKKKPNKHYKGNLTIYLRSAERRRK